MTTYMRDYSYLCRYHDVFFRFFWERAVIVGKKPEDQQILPGWPHWTFPGEFDSIIQVAIMDFDKNPFRLLGTRGQTSE